MNKIKRIAVLASGSGTNLQSLIDASASGGLSGAVICAVVSDKAGAYALERAKNVGIPAFELNKKSFETRVMFDAAMLQTLKEIRPDLIVLAGYLSIVPNAIVSEFAGRIINIHPSLIPKYCGMGFYGVKVHEAVINACETETGVTVHFVDEGVDTGKIILQQKISVSPAKTAAELAERVLELEHKLIVEAVNIVIKGEPKVKKRAIISVSDKTGLVPFAKGLIEKGYQIISTGGTAELLRKNGIETLEAEQVTGFPECLDGRVKTLHPKIHGGILARRDLDSHMQTLEKLGISTIDLICVNLYPFKNTVAKPGHTLEEAIENIDIGGPSLLRAGSKNYKFVTVVTDAADYDSVLKSMDGEGNVPQDLRFKLCAKSFLHTAAYDSYISQYLSKAAGMEKYPRQLSLTYELKQTLRYGENSHQSAAFYEELATDPAAITAAKFLQGKELSYNNIGDADGAIALMKEFSDAQESVCVAVKHANPCAVAMGKNSEEAYKRAYAADPLSIFGGIIAFNTVVDEKCAAEITKILTEIVIAPDFTEGALKQFATKENLRVLKLEGVAAKLNSKIMYKPVSNGLLVQDADEGAEERSNVVTKTTPNNMQLEQMTFAMKICKHVKSNAIVLTKDFVTVGIGGGSVSRIWAAQAAIERAGERAKGAVMASDAFFPFDDVVKECAKAGVVAIIQPGGSINDALSIKACDEANIPMIFTGIRHFKH